MPHSLVIGGTLFIGRAIVRRLLAAGHEVTILHRGKNNPFPGQVHELHADRNDPEATCPLIAGHSFDYVFDNVYDWQRGTTAEPVARSVLACDDKLKRYVFTSSVAVYDGGTDVSEDAPLVAETSSDVYARNKAESERELLRLHREQGLPVTTLRPPYIYGPENPFYREAFFWDRMLLGRKILVPGDGSRMMHFVLSTDYAAAALAAAQSPAANGKAYNIAHESAVSQGELVRLLAETADVDVESVFAAREDIRGEGGQVFEPPYYFGQYFDMPAITQSIAAARRDFGFAPTSFKDGLAQSFAWYREHARNPTPDMAWEDKFFASRASGRS